MRKSVFAHARVASVGKCELTSGPLKSSKGAAAFVLQLHNYATLCFISCHLEANKPWLRREQFKTCVKGLGASLPIGVCKGALACRTCCSMHRLAAADVSPRCHW